MKRTRKLQLAVSVLGVSAAVAGFALMSPVQAKADEQASFAMAKGAYVRAVENEAGIRWETSVNKAWYDENIATIANATDVSFGTLVTSVNNVTVDGVIDMELLTKDAKEVSALPCEAMPRFDRQPTFTYYSSIVYTEEDMGDWTTEEKQKAYAVELVARSYVKYSTDGGVTYTYKYADAEDTARCMRAVALAAYEDTSANAPTEDEKGYIDHYFKDKATGTVALNGDAYYETSVAETFANSQYTVAYAGAKKVGTFNGETATFDKLELGENYTLTLFDAQGNYAKTSSFQYVTKTLDYTNFKSVMQPATATTVTGYYVMTTDVDVAGSTAWTGTATLAGTLDGGNHKLTGLNVNRVTGLFANVDNATVKNIAIVDAQLADKSGLLVYSSSGDLTVDNVYISLGTQLFGMDNYEYNAKFAAAELAAGTQTGINKDWFQYKNGIVCAAGGSVNVKNSVIYMPEFVLNNSGFVAAYRASNNTEIVVDNCTFIGGNGKVNGTLYNQGTTTVTNTNITDAVAAHKTYKANWSEMQKAAYNANHPYVELNNENIASTILTLTNEIAVLAENIDGAESGLNTMVRGANTFAGVFDGQGKTISNLTSNNWDRGMLICKTLKGSVKNVAIKCEWSGYDGGVLADEINGGYIENVYVEQTAGAQNTDKVGAIAHKLTAGYMKNVVAYTIKNPNYECSNVSGLFGKCNASSLWVVMENCYYITPNESAYYVGVGTAGMTLENIQAQEALFSIQGFKGENAKETFDAAVADTENPLAMSDVLKAMVSASN